MIRIWMGLLSPIIFFQQSYLTALLLAATDENDQRAEWWSYGKFYASNYGSKVDVSAPGFEIMTTIQGTVESISGTSLAAPFVSGLSALLFSQHPEWTNLEVRSRIENTADPIDYLNPGYEGKLGKGRINAAKALTSKTSFTNGEGNEVESYYSGELLYRSGWDLSHYHRP